MPKYKHILIAVDLYPGGERVIEKTQALTGGAAKVSLLHVVEPVFSHGATLSAEYSRIQDGAIAFSLEELQKLGSRYDIPTTCQHSLVGSPKKVIREFSNANNVDLIVAGSHGKHGLQLLLGSTTSAILHGANCDVFVVRVDELT